MSSQPVATVVEISKDKGIAPAVPINTVSYKTPKNTLLIVIKAGMAKSQLPLSTVMIMGFMAGIFIGMGGLLAVIVGGGVNVTTFGPGIQKLAMGAVFPVGLILVVITGAELFTGNIMYMSAAVLAGKASWKQLGVNWLVSYVSNFAGCATMAYFGTYLCNMFENDPWHAFILNMTEKKVTMGWGTAVLKGIGANWLVCLALFLALASDSFEGKIYAIWWPIMTFVTVGYEHSIANMYYILTGLMYHSDRTFGDFIAWNLIPSTLGNIIAGFFFLALAYYYVYRDFAMPHISIMRIRNAAVRHKEHHAKKGSSLSESNGNGSTANGSVGNGAAPAANGRVEACV